MRGLPIIITFTCIAAVFLVCIPCAAAGNAAPCTPTIVDLKSYHWERIEGPEITGSTVVFSADGNITLYDLGTKRLSILTKDGNNTLFAAAKSAVVWVHKSPAGTADMYLYDLSTGQQRKIPGTNSPRIFRGLATDGRSIVWADSRNGNFDVFIYNIANGTETQLSKNPSDQEYPAIDGTKVVWTDTRRSNNYDIYLYDLADQLFSRITTDAAKFPNMPKISGTRIVWEDLRNDNNDAFTKGEPRYLTGNFDIYLYNLDTGKETQITTHTSAQREPALFGDTIVWNDQRDSPLIYPPPACPTGSFCPVETPPPSVYDIYLYNITTGTEEKLVRSNPTYNDRSYTGNPAINGDKIVWKAGEGIGVCDGSAGTASPQGQVVTVKAGETPLVVTPRSTPLPFEVSVAGILVGLVLFGLELKKKDR